MGYLLLLAAILLEVSGTTALKFSDGFTKLIPSILVLIFYSLSFYTLSLTLKRLEVSISYAIWSALGTALIATIAALWFREPMSIIKIGSLALIILGVIGLNLSGGVH